MQLRSCAFACFQRGLPGSCLNVSYRFRTDSDCNRSSCYISDENSSHQACKECGSHSPENVKMAEGTQDTFLRQFVQRLKLDWLQSHQERMNTSDAEPSLDRVREFLGTSESAVTHWVRRLMEEGLGWSHTMLFVCLAFRNRMAAQADRLMLQTLFVLIENVQEKYLGTLQC